METKHNPKLVSTELANLWTQYMNDSMAICVINYMLKKVEDSEIRSILEFSLSLSKHHTEVIESFLSEEKHPIPFGFVDEDVNLDAPRLFSDSFFLKYMHIMAAHGITGYAVASTTSVRSDMRKFYSECSMETLELFNRSLDLMLSKGLYSRPPYLNPPEKAKYVNEQGFLTGWFGNRRPLNGIETSNIIFNMNKMVMQKALFVGFSQVAEMENVRDYFMRGTQITSKHLENFSSLLHEDHLPTPPTWDSEVTNVTEAPFSDKLMMFHSSVLTQSAVAFYGAALAVSMRRDLATHYTRLTTELEQYGEDGANILIHNGWMEQPPTADDRIALASAKK